MFNCDSTMVTWLKKDFNNYKGCLMLHPQLTPVLEKIKEENKEFQYDSELRHIDEMENFLEEDFYCLKYKEIIVGIATSDTALNIVKDIFTHEIVAPEDFYDLDLKNTGAIDFANPKEISDNMVEFSIAKNGEIVSNNELEEILKRVV